MSPVRCRQRTPCASTSCCTRSSSWHSDQGVLDGARSLQMEFLMSIIITFSKHAFLHFSACSRDCQLHQLNKRHLRVESLDVPDLCSLGGRPAPRVDSDVVTPRPRPPHHALSPQTPGTLASLLREPLGNLTDQAHRRRSSGTSSASPSSISSLSRHRLPRPQLCPPSAETLRRSISSSSSGPV